MEPQLEVAGSGHDSPNPNKSRNLFSSSHKNPRRQCLDLPLKDSERSHEMQRVHCPGRLGLDWKKWISAVVISCRCPAKGNCSAKVQPEKKLREMPLHCEISLEVDLSFLQIPFPNVEYRRPSVLRTLSHCAIHPFIASK